MLAKNSKDKPALRARQSTVRKPQHTAREGRQTKAANARQLGTAKPATAPKRTPVKAADFDYRYQYDHWCLVTGFILFVADGLGRLHVAFARDPAAYLRKLRKQVGGELRVTSAVLAPEYALAHMEDELTPFRAEAPMFCAEQSMRHRHNRTDAVIEIERNAETLVRRWCEMFKKDGRAEEAQRRREWMRNIIAPRVKAHNAFMASLTKHTKALAALAR